MNNHNNYRELQEIKINKKILKINNFKKYLEMMMINNHVNIFHFIISGV